MGSGLATRSIPVLALAAALASGCANEAWIADRATTYNKALEQTGNQELLLNILRASRRRPEYFSYISQVHGGSGLSLPSASLSWPFGAGSGGAAHTATATLGYVGTGSFDVGALDTSDFMRGITSPVATSTIAHYWGQGWSPELLWFLLVRKIELRREPGPSADPAHDLWMRRDAWPPGTHFSKANPRLVTFENYPGNDDDFQAFKRISRRLLDESFGLNPREVRYWTNVGPPLDAARVADVKQIAEDATHGITLAKLPDGRWQPRKAERVFAFSYPGACFGAVTTTGYAKPPDEDEDERAVAMDHCRKPPQKITLYLRSPEGIQYYLGQLLRVGLRKAAEGKPNGLTARVCGRSGRDRRETLLFDVRRLAGDASAPLEVEFDGERYGVPPEAATTDEFAQCDAESTMHVLSFVSQLLSLQRSARDLPTTGVVHVVQ